MGCVVNTTPRPLYPMKRPRTLCTGEWVDPKVGLDVFGKSRPHRDSTLDHPSPLPLALTNDRAEVDQSLELVTLRLPGYQLYRD
jgi:hypothetical protein